MSELPFLIECAYKSLGKYIIKEIVNIIITEYYLPTHSLNILKDFNDPFTHLSNREYSLVKIYRTSPMCNVNINKLQKWNEKISEIYYYEANTEGWDSDWTLVCCVKNGIYLAFHANCSYSGFDACGGMRLYTAENIWDFFFYCVDERIRTNILKTISP
jgi:hypothetical protein